VKAHKREEEEEEKEGEEGGGYLGEYADLTTVGGGRGEGKGGIGNLESPSALHSRLQPPGRKRRKRRRRRRKR